MILSREAERRNPSGQHRVSGSGQAKIKGGADRNQGWIYSSCECTNGKDAQRYDGFIRGKVEVHFASWLDMKKENVEKLEYRPGLCRNEIKRWNPTVFERSREYVMFLFTKAMTVRSEVSGSLTRKIMFSDVSGVHYRANTIRDCT